MKKKQATLPIEQFATAESKTEFRSVRPLTQKPMVSALELSDAYEQTLRRARIKAGA